MELISNRCTQCMGEVQPMPDGIHAKCVYCGAVYLLPEDQRVSRGDSRAQRQEEVYEDFAEGGEFDLEGIIEDVLSDGSITLIGTLWGNRVDEKEGAARKFFGIPRDDDVYLILDTTIFGSCKVGLALCTSGICMKDEDGAVRSIGWDELADGLDFSYEGGTLVIDGSKFFSSDGEYICVILERALEAYGQGYSSGEFDLEGIIEDVMDASDASANDIRWGNRVDEKEGAARKFFGIPRDDDVYLILDTTLFGSCKVGLALCTSGICMKDEDGAVRSIGWDEFGNGMDFSYESGTLVIDGSKFFSSDGECVNDVLEQVSRAL